MSKIWDYLEFICHSRTTQFSLDFRRSDKPLDHLHYGHLKVWISGVWYSDDHCMWLLYFSGCHAADGWRIGLRRRWENVFWDWSSPQTWRPLHLHLTASTSHPWTPRTVVCKFGKTLFVNHLSMVFLHLSFFFYLWNTGLETRFSKSVLKLWPSPPPTLIWKVTALSITPQVVYML